MTKITLSDDFEIHKSHNPLTGTMAGLWCKAGEHFPITVFPRCPVCKIIPSDILDLYKFLVPSKNHIVDQIKQRQKAP